jgi:hypothetical protein
MVPTIENPQGDHNAEKPASSASIMITGAASPQNAIGGNAKVISPPARKATVRRTDRRRRVGNTIMVFWVVSGIMV